MLELDTRQIRMGQRAADKAEALRDRKSVV